MRPSVSPAKPASARFSGGLGRMGSRRRSAVGSLTHTFQAGRDRGGGHADLSAAPDPAADLTAGAAAYTAVGASDRRVGARGTFRNFRRGHPGFDMHREPRRTRVSDKGSRSAHAAPGGSLVARRMGLRPSSCLSRSPASGSSTAMTLPSGGCRSAGLQSPTCSRSRPACVYSPVARTRRPTHSFRFDSSPLPGTGFWWSD